MFAQQKLPPDLNLLELEEYRDKLKRQQAAVSTTFREVFKRNFTLQMLLAAPFCDTYDIADSLASQIILFVYDKICDFVTWHDALYSVQFSFIT